MLQREEAGRGAEEQPSDNPPSADLIHIFLCFVIFLFFRERGFFLDKARKGSTAQRAPYVLVGLHVIGMVMGIY